jgi:hypothetical protein
LDSNDVSLDDPYAGCNQHRLAISAAFDGSALLDEVVQRLKEMNNIIDIKTAETFLQRLRHWTQSLPHALRQFTKIDDAPVTEIHREKVIGNVNVSCIYYFAVILTTRSFLISHLMSRLREGTRTTPTPATPTTGAENSVKVSQLADVCTSSAIYMADMCDKAMTSGLLLNNMCIMK